MPYLDEIARAHGLTPQYMRASRQIESGGNPNAQTGRYKGLYMMPDDDFAKYGPPGGNIFDPVHNATAFARRSVAWGKNFEAKYGRPPSDFDRYFIHQQGPGGYDVHTRNPDAPAWQNMHSTGEGRAKGPGWARQAIWGNVPSDRRHNYPQGVAGVSSGQFVDLWRDRWARAVKAAGGADPGGAPAGTTAAPMTAAHVGAQQAAPYFPPQQQQSEADNNALLQMAMQHIRQEAPPMIKPMNVLGFPAP